jgi:hypothetical protein
MADRLGSSRFRVAKDLAALVRGGLVESVGPIAEPVSRYEAPRSTATPAEPAYTPSEAITAQDTFDHQYTPEPVAAVEAIPSEAVAEPVVEDTTPDYNRSWWSEAVESKDDASTEPAAEGEETPATGESFLDRVFSQLNENPEGQGGPSPVSNHGFLKRRRMSSVGLDE